MIWRTKSLKKLLLFLDTRQDHTANYKQIKATFPPEMDIDKIIAGVLDKNWIVKNSGNKYKLTKTGEYEIQKMTKEQKNEITIDFRLIKWVFCTNCGRTFHTKGTSSWCNECKQRHTRT